MPTRIRYRIIGTTTLVAILLYLDRVCLAEIAKLDDFKLQLGIDDTQKGWILASFFLAYALAQVPAGWLGDRLGARKMLTIYILLWSLCTMLTGFVTGFVMFIVARMIFGVAQAGCYPTSGSLIKRWVPVESRGTASGFISVGGRVGGALTPALTAWLLADHLDWRWTLVLYGASGILIAAVFWFTVRESPAEHPLSNEAEQLLVDGTAEPEPPRPPIGRLLVNLMRSPSMWMMCVLQWAINVGWAPLVTWLPTFLKDVKGVPAKEAGWMSTVVLVAGIVGMFAGGPLTDMLVKKYGLRIGRGIPFVATKFVAMFAYIACLWLDSPWLIVIALATVAFMTDLGVPAIWAYMMDVGGRNAAAVFGWGNMWGNLGAFAIALSLPLIRDWLGTEDDWSGVWLFLAGGFALAGIAAFWINPTKRIA